MPVRDYKLNFLYFTLSLLLFIPPLCATKSKEETYLDWKERPASIQLQIQSAFEMLEKKTASSWDVYNGADAYNLCTIDDYKLINAIISCTPIEQKDIFIIDIGAGKFQWGRSMAKHINDQADFRKDLTVNILSIRGESNLEVEKTTIGQCILYEYGSFKIEDLIAEFNKRGHLLESNVDFIVSRWCFRHLVDPVGTFIQAYNLLRPKTGLILMDGFCILYEKDLFENYIDAIELPFSYMLDVLINTKAPYLVYPFNGDCSVNQFILRRESDQTLQLPLSYITTVTADKSVSKSGYITQFNYSGEQRKI